MDPTSPTAGGAAQRDALHRLAPLTLLDVSSPRLGLQDHGVLDTPHAMAELMDQPGEFDDLIQFLGNDDSGF